MSLAAGVGEGAVRLMPQSPDYDANSVCNGLCKRIEASLAYVEDIVPLTKGDEVS